MTTSRTSAPGAGLTDGPIIETVELGRDFVVHTGSRLRRSRTVVHALEDLTVSVAAGEAVGYIGANGAGKSTTIKMLTGILIPTRGTVRTCGLDPVPARRLLARRIGVVFGQRSALWWDLPLRDTFPILAAMHRLTEATWRPRFDTLADELDLGRFLDTPVRQLSLGQRMRGEVAAALLHSPELVILDEPTIGLDMISKESLRQFLIRERHDRGTTLLLTTHDMADVQRLCDRMLVIDHGRVAFDGTEGELATVTDAERLMVVDVAEPVDVSLPMGAHVVSTEGEGRRITIGFRPGVLTAAELLAVVSSRTQVIDLTLAEPDIEDLVRQIYQRGASNR